MLSEGVGGLKEQMSGLVDISGVQEGTSAFKEDTLHHWVPGAGVFQMEFGYKGLHKPGVGLVPF